MNIHFIWRTSTVSISTLLVSCSPMTCYRSCKKWIAISSTYYYFSMLLLFFFNLKKKNMFFLGMDHVLILIFEEVHKLLTISIQFLFITLSILILSSFLWKYVIFFFLNELKWCRLCVLFSLWMSSYQEKMVGKYL